MDRVTALACPNNNLRDHAHRCTYLSPLEKPFGLVRRQVHTAVTHRTAKLVMPVGTVNGITLEEIHRIRYLGEKLVWPLHIVGDILDIDFVITDHGWGLRQSG